ncbi:MAG: septum formation initiator family protein [Prolixibacteraceae bacterium]|nr:septum formation initiator family protein [Prolixibacteraceae bacterium]
MNMKEYLLDIVKKYKIQLGLLIFFLVWMLFFDEYNWLRIRNDSNKLENLKQEKVYLEEKIEKDKQQLHTLQNDTEALERFAREEYMLKKDNEEVYIIIDDEEN